MNPQAHADAFNDAVRTGSWNAFVSRFDEDATVEFVGPPVGPFVGRTAILAAYTSQPPDDTITLHEPWRQEADEIVAPYRWDTTGATGTMRFTQGPAGIVRLVITFD